MTPRDIIKAAMKKIGALAAGETPTADELSDGMSALNLMLDSFSNEKVMIYTTIRETFAMTAGQATATLGSGGTYDTTRPVHIERAGVLDSSGMEIPIDVINQDQWALITNKSLTADRPTQIYYEPTYPLGTINFWPIPSGSSSLVLYSWKPLTTFTSASAVLEFPPGYERMLVFNLAVEWAPEFGKSASPDVVAIANESKAAIKRINTNPEYIASELSLLRRGNAFNIYIG